MGEYADMMIEGDCCQSCGDFIGPGDGFARFCADCGGDPETGMVKQKRKQKPPKPKPFPCGECKKSFATAQAVNDHLRDAHGITED